MTLKQLEKDVKHRIASHLPIAAWEIVVLGMKRPSDYWLSVTDQMLYFRK